MTLGEYIQQFPDTLFSLSYQFEFFCPVCRQVCTEEDYEYSFDVKASEIGTTGYDWIFDQFSPDDYNVNISDDFICITVSSEDSICSDCSDKHRRFK